MKQTWRMITLAAAAILVAGIGFAQSQAVPQGYAAIRSAPAPGLAPSMKVKDMGTAGHVYEVTFGKGDEVASGLTEFAEKHHITAAHFTGVGEFGSAVLGWTDLQKRAFKKIDINSNAEVVAFAGNISMRNGHPYVHAHCAVSLQDGDVRGGHFIEGHVAVIMQVYVTDDSPATSAKANP